jgi:hypothetical protein
MDTDSERTKVIRLQNILIWAVGVAFCLGIIIGFFDEKLGRLICFVDVLLLIMAAPLRVIWLSEYFRKAGERKYGILAYLVIVIIALTALVRSIL